MRLTRGQCRLPALARTGDLHGRGLHHEVLQARTVQGPRDYRMGMGLRVDLVPFSQITARGMALLRVVAVVEVMQR